MRASPDVRTKAVVDRATPGASRRARAVARGIDWSEGEKLRLGVLTSALVALALAMLIALTGLAQAQTADTSGTDSRVEATQGTSLDTGAARNVTVPPRVDGARLDPTAPLPGSTVSSTPNAENAEFWRQLREGGQGNVSIPNAQAGILIQDSGEAWLQRRSGPVTVLSGVAIVGMLILLSLFFALRGRIRIEEGPSRYEVKRFNLLDRTAHWLMALSFIVLAVSGFNLLYGRPLLIPLIGKEGFASLAMFMKSAHNYVAFAFMLSLVLSLVLWVKNNLPSRTDWQWIKAGGGAFGHAPAKKFNAGQKILFWLVMLMGLSVSLSGWALLFPFETTMFADTFALFGSGPVSAIEEQQYAQTWHTIVSVAFVVMIFAHIYIGTVGMEGAFAAMGRGKVDYNWAREHHGLWVDELEAKGRYPTIKDERDLPQRDPPPAGAYVAPAE